MIGHEFEVWVCPECLGCFASQSTEGIDLASEFNKDIKNRPTFSRSRCPNCSTESKEVHRIRCIAKVIRRWELPRPEMTEEQYWNHVEQHHRKEVPSARVGEQDFPVRSGPLPPES